VSESVTNSALWNTRRPPRGNTVLPSMGALFGALHSTLLLVGTKLEFMYKNSDVEESSYVGDYSKGSKEGSSQGELLCLKTVHGATEQNSEMQGAGKPPKTWEDHLSSSSLSSENLEALTEMVGTLGLQSLKTNHVVPLRSEQGRLRLRRFIQVGLRQWPISASSKQSVTKPAENWCNWCSS
jgi:hypothetical protein